MYLRSIKEEGAEKGEKAEEEVAAGSGSYGTSEETSGFGVCSQCDGKSLSDSV